MRNPFLTLAIVALVIWPVAAEPEGYDWDPHPVRQPLRRVLFVIGFPFVLSGATIGHLIREGGTYLFFPWMVLGFLPYIAADWLWQRHRARRKPAA